MLNHVSKCLILVLLGLLTACHQRGQENKERNQKISELSKITIGRQEYHKLYKQVSDSLDLWCLTKLPAYESVWYYNYRLDSVLCFNSSKDRMVTGILIQCDKPTYHISMVLKSKINGIFLEGGAMAILREHYQKDIHTPLSFEKLHEIAMNNMLKGYLKKNLKDEWEINDAFFTSQLEHVGWGDFKRYQDTVVYGKRFANKKEYFENIYLRVAKNR